MTTIQGLLFLTEEKKEGYMVIDQSFTVLPVSSDGSVKCASVFLVLVHPCVCVCERENSQAIRG